MQQNVSGKWIAKCNEKWGYWFFNIYKKLVGLQLVWFTKQLFIAEKNTFTMRSKVYSELSKLHNRSYSL